MYLKDDLLFIVLIFVYKIVRFKTVTLYIYIIVCIYKYNCLDKSTSIVYRNINFKISKY